MAYQSLYRRYRPQKFAEIQGQEHVVAALQNAVREDRVGHAYLLSGPRGTGKTTAARVLAKVLNCTNVVDGEPCGECDSCQSIESGTSFDLHELDAASNNKVDDIRDLLSKVALGTPGRTKVYLLDEVHMLTAGAENALLKTLEEPPEHVVFVLATTEPHKVVSTIRSRTQQLQLTLIPADQMTALVREIATDAGLEVDDEAVNHVVKVGGGSARDTLSALDQVVAAGGVTDADESTAELLEALATLDSATAIAAIEFATTRGVDPRRIGERFIDALRSVFLQKMGSPPERLSEGEQLLATTYAERLSPATITRSLETIGRSLVDMRQAPDPRIDLEVAFVKITKPAASNDTASLIARIEQLEAALAAGGAPVAATSPATGAPVVDPTPAAVAIDPTPAADPTLTTDAAPADPVQEAALPEAAEQPAEPAPAPAPAARTVRPADAARAVLAQKKGGKQQPAPSAPPADLASTDHTPKVAAKASAPMPPSMRRESEATPAAPQPAAAPVEPSAPHEQPDTEPESAAPVVGGAGLSVDAIRDGWGTMLDGQATKIRARFLAGTVGTVADGTVTLMLPTEAQIKRCEPFISQVEAAMTDTFGQPLKLAFATGDLAASASTPAAATPQPAAEEEVDIHDLTDADVGNSTVVDRIADVFPGAEMMPPDES